MRSSISVAAFAAVLVACGAASLTRPFVGAYAKGPWSTAGALQLGKPDVIFLAFANPTYDSSSDGFNLEAGFRHFNTTFSLGVIKHAQANGAEVIASIGGYTWRDATAAALQQQCTKFVSAISDLVQNTGVDGIEIAQIRLDGTQGAEVPSVVACFRDLRSALKNKKLVVALPATSPSSSNAANKHPRDLIRLLAASPDKLVDWISIMEYDIPLQYTEWNTSTDIQHYIDDLRVAPSQLVLSLKPGLDDRNYTCTSASRVLDLTTRTVALIKLRGVSTGFLDEDTPKYTGMRRDGGVTFLAKTALTDPQTKPSWWLPMACPVEIPISLNISRDVILPSPHLFCTDRIMLDFTKYLKQKWDITCDGGKSRILSISARCSDSHVLNLDVSFINRDMDASAVTKIESPCFNLKHIANSSAMGLNHVIINNPGGVFVNSTKNITGSELLADAKCPPCFDYCNFDHVPQILTPFPCPSTAGQCIPHDGQNLCICNSGFEGPNRGETLQPWCKPSDVSPTVSPPDDWGLIAKIGLLAGLLASLATTVFTIAKTRSKLRKRAHTTEGEDQDLCCCIQDRIVRGILFVHVADAGKREEPLLNPVAQQKIQEKDREITSLTEKNYRLWLESKNYKMINISFTQPTQKSKSLGLAFAKNKAGYFVVKNAFGQSQTNGVEPGDIIVQVGETPINHNMKQKEVADKIRLNLELLDGEQRSFTVTFARLPFAAV
jgi:hypothetical protein